MFNLTSQIIIFIVLILFIVIVNYVIFSTLRKKNGTSEFDLIRKSTNSIRKPFEKEDQQINELSRMVNKLNINQKEENN